MDRDQHPHSQLAPNRIVVVGGGIGGLALAAGLRRHDFDVTVYERDIDLRATGGYHITLDDRAQQALQQLVEPVVFERLLASASALRLRDPDVFWDRRGRVIGYGPELGTSTSIDVDRITLRLLLAEAAGDRLVTGRSARTVGRTERPYVGFADGTTVEADLVVGADGPHSVVARRLAGGPTNRPAGIIGYSGRTRAEALSAADRDRFGPRSGFAVGPRGAALYVGFLDPVGRAVLDAPELRSSVTDGPTYIWGAMFPESAWTEALRDHAGADLRNGLLHLFRDHGWSPALLGVLEQTIPDSVAGFRFNAASTRAQDQAPWPAGDITALGDAVHATPPTAGMGAGAAIRDAADLVERLVAVRAGQLTLRVAIRDFEHELRLRGAEVLTLAMKTVDRILSTDTTLGAAATAAALPVLAAGQRFSRSRER